MDFLFLFLYFLSRCSGTNCITAPFQTHLDVTSQPAQRHLVLFNLMLLFFFFHTHTNCVTLPTAGIHYRRETGERLFKAFFLFLLLNSSSKRCVKPRESEAAIQCPGQVLLPRELRALSLDLIVSTCADGGPSHGLPRINPAAGICSLPESRCEQSALNTKMLIKIGLAQTQDFLPSARLLLPAV